MITRFCYQNDRKKIGDAKCAPYYTVQVKSYLIEMSSTSKIRVE